MGVWVLIMKHFFKSCHNFRKPHESDFQNGLSVALIIFSSYSVSQNVRTIDFSWYFEGPRNDPPGKMLSWDTLSQGKANFSTICRHEAWFCCFVVDTPLFYQKLMHIFSYFTVRWNMSHISLSILRHPICCVKPYEFHGILCAKLKSLLLL